MFQRTCPRCGGEGEKLEKHCSACRGSGRVERTRKLNVKIPAGIDSGSRLKISGEGEAGHRGGAAGHLYVLVAVKEHSLFERDGQDLYCEWAIPFTVACMGGQVEIPTLVDGKTKLKIPAGTPSGKVFRISGKGMTGLHGHGRGDQVVRVKIEVPAHLSEREKKLLEELAKIRGEEASGPKGFMERMKEKF